MTDPSQQFLADYLTYGSLPNSLRFFRSAPAPTFGAVIFAAKGKNDTVGTPPDFTGMLFATLGALRGNLRQLTDQSPIQPVDGQGTRENFLASFNDLLIYYTHLNTQYSLLKSHYSNLTTQISLLKSHY